jgi:hypothetical protein
VEDEQTGIALASAAQRSIDRVLVAKISLDDRLNVLDIWDVQ